MADQDRVPSGFITGVVRLFLESKLPILFILFAMAMGAASIYVTPREEEPQIVVPLADVFVQAPGASAEEVEKLVATPLERLLWQIDGVEYVYSTSHRDMAVVTVRFFVGQDRERSIVKLRNKISMNQDHVPPIVKGWVVKPVEIDDVPIVNLTLFSDRYDDHALTRIGQEVLARLSEVEDISRTHIVGGRKREVRVELLPDRMSGLGVSMLEVSQALAGTDASVTAGTFSRANQEITVTGDGFVCCARDVESLVVGVHGDRPVYLRDIARIIDGPEEAVSYSRFGYSHHYKQEKGLENTPADYPAVTLALAKKKGTNAVDVAPGCPRQAGGTEKRCYSPGCFHNNNPGLWRDRPDQSGRSLGLVVFCHSHRGGPACVYPGLERGHGCGSGRAHQFCPGFVREHGVRLYH